MERINDDDDDDNWNDDGDSEIIAGKGFTVAFIWFRDGFGLRMGMHDVIVSSKSGWNI